MPIITDQNRRITDLATLHPRMREKVRAVQAQLDTEGIPLRVFEAFRTPYRQRYLYAQGRTRDLNKAKVTNAEAWQSNHQYGCAVDFVFYEGGEWHWGRNARHKQWYDRLHQVGRAQGLRPLSWETPHLEMDDVDTDDLKRGRYPAAGDEAWAQNLIDYIEAWNDSPKAPPAPAIVTPERPSEAEIGAVVGDEPGAVALSAAAPAGLPIPAPDAFNLRSRAFAGNLALEAVADGHRLLRATGSRVEGIGLVQDALNRLSVRVPHYRIELGAYRGYFGQKTEQAIRAYQEDFDLAIDGEVGMETIRSLDAIMAAFEAGGNPLVLAGNAPVLASGGNYMPPSASAPLLEGIDFALADAQPGSDFIQIYAKADADPKGAKG
ncbi:MAG: hypothetical protein EOO81_11305, partial [Oxalobacteraceae bacterium]